MHIEEVSFQFYVIFVISFLASKVDALAAAAVLDGLEELGRVVAQVHVHAVELDPAHSILVHFERDFYSDVLIKHQVVVIVVQSVGQF